MRKKRFLSLLAAVAVTFCLVGCRSDTDTGHVELIDEVSQQITTVTEQIEQTSDLSEIKTIEPPEDGWTLEQLNEVMYLNGKPFKLPCTLEDLGNEYTVDDRNINKYTGYIHTTLYFNSIRIGQITLQEINNNEHKIIAILFVKSVSPDNFNEKFVINNLTLNSAQSDVEMLLGKNYDESESGYVYQVKNSSYDYGISIIFSSVNLNDINMINVYETNFGSGGTDNE